MGRDPGVPGALSNEPDRRQLEFPNPDPGYRSLPILRGLRRRKGHDLLQELFQAFGALGGGFEQLLGLFFGQALHRVRLAIGLAFLVLFLLLVVRLTILLLLVFLLVLLFFVLLFVLLLVLLLLVLLFFVLLPSCCSSCSCCSCWSCCCSFCCSSCCCSSC